MAPPAVNALWRPNTASPKIDDLGRIRALICWPASDTSLTWLIQQLNSVASVSPNTVLQVQAWLDEVTTLEETQSDEIDSGIAHLSNAEEYEGPIPGVTLTKEERESQVGRLSWDTSLLKARYRFGSGARATAQGQRDERIELLTGRIATALNVQRLPRGGYGAGMLLRS